MEYLTWWFARKNLLSATFHMLSRRRSMSLSVLSTRKGLGAHIVRPVAAVIAEPCKAPLPPNDVRISLTNK
jgi:hypothetical protein